MKVACIGNMNNMLFSLTRYLREHGIDAHLFLPANELNGMDHFLPENDHFDESYKSYTHHLDWGSGGNEVYKNATIQHIRNDLKEYHFFIVCGVSIGYLHKAGLQADIFFPHGKDITHSSKLVDQFSILNRIRNPYGYEFYKNVKLGIKASLLINLEYSDPFWKEPLVYLNILEKANYIGCPMIFDGIYGKSSIAKWGPLLKEFDSYIAMRQQNDLLVVNQAAQRWAAPVDKNGMLSKGSDSVIRGFSLFLKSKPDSYRASLVLFEYGNDVEASKKLIDELGIGKNVVWHPLAPRKAIMTLLSMADFGCGEFNLGCIGGNTTWESLASGACLLHYLNAEFTKFDGFMDSSYPFVNVKEPSEIMSVLLDFVSNPDKYKEIGAAGTRWYKKYFAGKSVREHIALIERKAQSQLLS